MSSTVLLRTRSAIFSSSVDLSTRNGISVTMMFSRPSLRVSMWVRARSWIEPRPAAVRHLHPVHPLDNSPGGEIGCLDLLHQFGQPDLGVVDQGGQRIGDLADVVRWNPRRHADPDADGAIAQKVRELGRQHRRFLAGLVVVVDKVDGVPVDVGQQFDCRRGQPCLRVAHGRGRIAVDGAEVALAVDEG